MTKEAMWRRDTLEAGGVSSAVAPQKSPTLGKSPRCDRRLGDDDDDPSTSGSPATLSFVMAPAHLGLAPLPQWSRRLQREK